MRNTHKQAGFTILELMIATMVFSVILLLVTYGIIQIGNRYYKSVLQTQTQTATRNAVDEIARNIQFSSGGVVPKVAFSPPIKAYCINGIQYAAQLQRIQGESISKHVFVARPDPGDGCTPPDPTTYFEADSIGSDRDLLGNRMRVVDFSITPGAQTGVYTIKLRVASGQDDLLCSPSANDCNDTTPSGNLDRGDLACKTQKGSAYCAVSELSTTVISRLTP